jgi:hypothetical protein
MYVCIMHQCFDVGTLYGSWLGLTIPAQRWDVTVKLSPRPSQRSPLAPMASSTLGCVRYRRSLVGSGWFRS